MDSESEQQPLSDRQRWIVFGAATLAAWGYAAAATIANAMLPQIQGDLSASLDQVSWIITASIVASALGIPPTPWLSARYGRKTVLLVALVSFTVSSIMIAVSSSLGEVVFWRIVQALFGAPIMVLSQSLTVSSFDGPRRGVAMSIWSVALTTGWVFGPAIGAYLADLYSWRAAFFMVSPVSVLSIFVCATVIPKDRSDTRLTFDWLGFGALSLCIGAVQMVVNLGQRNDWFDSQQIVMLAIMAGVSLAMYAAHTFTSDKRFIRWEIYLDRNLAVGVLITCIFGFISLAPLVLVPPMLAQIKGLEVVTIGLVVTPRGVIQIVLMLLLGPYVSRIDPRLLMGSGFSCFAVASWMMTNYSQDIGLAEILIPQLLLGVFSALTWLPLFHVLYSTLQEDYRDEASMSVGLAYNLVSSAGVALLVVILSRSLQINTEELGANISLSSELLRFPEHALFDVRNAVDAAAVHAEIAQQALMIGYINIFWLLTWISILSIPLLALIPSAKRNRALLEARAQAKASST
ncbi:MAG: hypothetical protein CMO26_00840 [Thiotrichales bacterium]|nr:hypothetical protein [Thiotrichales bacterium]